MKKTKIRSYASIGAALTFLLALAAAPAVARDHTISKTERAGAYSVNLKVLPAESFTGPKAEMVRDAGAEPTLVTGPEHPNHHVVAFVKKDGKPVEEADVQIGYRSASTSPGAWIELPVTRMHVAGKGLDSTHYGNNVNLPAGTYEVRVTVSGAGPAQFRISLP
jgi:hypothetical protein